MRYRFYREHKYVSYMLTEFERKVAKTDFSNSIEIAALQDPFNTLWALMQGHAKYEDNAIHTLLLNKEKSLPTIIAQDHADFEQRFIELAQGLDNIFHCDDAKERLELGYIFYLSYRFFVAENLRHIHLEETVLMPILQELYVDEILANVEATTYKNMTSQQMIEMMAHLFPHMDINDKVFFLSDIQRAEPEKFNIAYAGILPTLTSNEQKKISILFPV
ncbi:MAG: hemerythrin domain-containing protein [Proteobacteria bacterium]|nr:hemerythrin domain-containing protein [Pseudomonadota bacterium]